MLMTFNKLYFNFSRWNVLLLIYNFKLINILRAKYLDGKPWSCVDLWKNENAVDALLFVAASKYMICNKTTWTFLHLPSAIIFFWPALEPLVLYYTTQINIGRSNIFTHSITLQQNLLQHLVFKLLHLCIFKKINMVELAVLFMPK